MRDFDLGRAVRAGFDLLRDRPVAGLGLALVGAVASVSGRAASVVATHFAVDRPGGPVSSAVIFMLNGLFGLLVLGLVSAIIGAAVMRAIGDESRRSLRPRLGGDEARLFLLFLLTVPAWLVLAMAIGIGTSLMTMRHPGATGVSLLTILLAVAALALVCGPASRLWLGGPMTVRDGRLRLMASWRLTRGRAWTKVFVVLLSTALMCGALSFLGNLLLTKAVMALNLRTPPEAYGRSLVAALIAFFAQPLGLVVVLLRGLVTGLAVILLAAPAAYVHRRLAGDPPADQAAVFD